jgi:hypothetical protein
LALAECALVFGDWVQLQEIAGQDTDGREWHRLLQAVVTRRDVGPDTCTIAVNVLAQHGETFQPLATYRYEARRVRPSLLQQLARLWDVFAAPFSRLRLPPAEPRLVPRG